MADSNDSNRRTATRRLAAVPVQIDTVERKERLGVTKDVSRSGTLLVSNSKFEVGERVQVTLHLSMDEADAHTIDGSVVRVVKLGPEYGWRFAMAVQFDSPLPVDKEAALAERT